MVKRTYVLKELLQTEQDYVSKLKTICEVIRPHAIKAKYLPPDLKEKLDFVFCNVQAIYEFHRDLILVDMEATLRGEFLVFCNL